MTKKMWAGVVIVVILLAVIQFFEKAKIAKIQDQDIKFINPSPDAVSQPTDQSGPFEGLPESSAIRQSLVKKRAVDELLKSQFEKKLKEEKREKLAIELRDEFNIEWQISGAQHHPQYPQCFRNREDSYTGTYTARKCVFVTFTVDRFAKSDELKKIFLLAKNAGIKIILTDSFWVYSGWVTIDVNANDQTIIEFLIGKKPEPPNESQSYNSQDSPFQKPTPSNKPQITK